MEGSAARRHLENLRHPDDSVSHKAYLSLLDSGANPSWVPDLIAAASDDDPYVRSVAASALGRPNEAYAAAIPALLRLLSDPEDHIRCTAARALGQMRHWSAGAAVPALARRLETDPSHYPREYAVRALHDLWPWNADAIEVLIAALDDPHENVRRVAIGALNLLRVRASAALPALRRVAADDDIEGNRADAQQAINWILQGTPAIRYDNPYRALTIILEIGRFTDSSSTEVPELLEREDYQRAFDIVEAALEPDGQDEQIWAELWCVAQVLDRPTAARYGARAEEAWGGGVWRDVERAVRSKTTVAKGLAKIVRYHARIEPHPDWKLLDRLPIDEELARLEIWISSAFSEEPPPDDAPGLWFELVSRSCNGEDIRGIRLDAGQLYGDDRVIGGSWAPRDEFAYSEVLDRIYGICHQDQGNPLADAETTISLTYAALAIRALATTIDSDLLLGTATQRVVAVGYPDGDCIGIGTLREDGLKFPRGSA